MRDTQRSKLYKAESAAFEPAGMTAAAKDAAKPTAPMLLDDVHTLLYQLRTDKRLTEEGLLLNRLIVKDGRGCRSATCDADTMTLPVWARKRWVVLHEAAHGIVERQRRQAVIAAINARPRHSVDFPHAAHGWLFARTYLRLVRLYLGVAAEKELKKQFRAHRVKFAPPRPKREYTPEQKLAMALRLQAARELKAARALANAA